VRTPLLLAEPCCIHHRKSRMNFLQILAFHSTFNIHSCQARNKEQHQLIYIEWIQFILHYECQFQSISTICVKIKFLLQTYPY
jgi:hypothetical protein